MATYAAAKAFVLHFTEALKFELRGRGVQVMAVLPWADGDEFLRGCFNQDEGRWVRQRRAGKHFANIAAAAETFRTR
jgi:short-subunit dehydrogenase